MLKREAVTTPIQPIVSPLWSQAHPPSPHPQMPWGWPVGDPEQEDLFFFFFLLVGKRNGSENQSSFMESADGYHNKDDDR